MSGYKLSVDYGTTYSLGVVSSELGVKVLELGRSRYVPSLVLLGEDGRLVVGEEAVVALEQRGLVVAQSWWWAVRALA